MQDLQRNRLIIGLSIICCIVLISSVFLPWTYSREVRDKGLKYKYKTFLIQRPGEREWIPGERAIILVLALWALVRLSQGMATPLDRPNNMTRSAPIVAGIVGICVFAIEYCFTLRSFMYHPYYIDYWGDMHVGTGVQVCAISGGLLAGLAATLPKRVD